MSRFLTGTPYLVILPIIGLAIAASFFFVLGGICLIRMLVELLLAALGAAQHPIEMDWAEIIFEVVEYVHLFLVGTVLYITAIGLYPLFVQEIKFANWLRIDSTEELETSLIGVTVVVLAVNFVGFVYVGGTGNLLNYGAGITLPIAALGLFVGLRAWSVNLNKEAAAIHKDDG
jgi:uncharacterized membrane protein YqhA